MTEHYYSEKPETKSEPIVWRTQLRNHPFVFTTDNSVFSKHSVDFGSRLLLETFEGRSSMSAVVMGRLDFLLPNHIRIVLSI